MPPVIPSFLIALPDLLLTTSLTEALRPYGDVHLVANSWNDFEDTLETLHPAAVVVDVVVGGVALLTHLPQLVTGYAPAHFVVCTSNPDGVVVQRALLAGAVAVVGHDVLAAAFGEALATLCRGGNWPDGPGVGAVNHSVRRAPLKPLRARLRQVNELLWQGKRQVEIMEELRLGLSTVQRYITDIRHAYAVPEGLPGPWEEARTARRGRKRRGEGN